MAGGGFSDPERGDAFDAVVPAVESAAIDFYGPHTFARFMGGIGLPDADEDPIRTAAMPPA